MECSVVEDKLYEYIYGELNDIAAYEIEEHLSSCGKCRIEYQELKKLLIDDMTELIELKEKIEVPQNLSYKIKSSISRKPRPSFIKYAIAACIVFSLIFTTPVLAYYIIQSTPLDKYMDLDKGVIVDFEEGQGQLVQKSSTMSNVTLTVDGIIRKSDKTTILFTLKVPKDQYINYGVPVSSGFNIVTAKDQFGKIYRMKGASLTVKSVNEDGEAKCIYDVEPIYFWAYKLDIRVTAIELGQYSDSTSMEKVKNIYGNWNVSFYVNRSSSGR